MDERRLRFRVGAFVLFALATAAVLVFQFGKLDSYFRPKYTIQVFFESAGGLHPGTPVKRNGIVIGRVAKIAYDEELGGVLVDVDVYVPNRLRKGARPVLSRPLLGSVAVNVTTGDGPEFVPPGSRLRGRVSTDPMDVVKRVEERTATALESFTRTSEEWAAVGRNVNGLMDTHREKLDVVLDEAIVSLQRFSTTMQTANDTLASANAILADPEHQRQIEETLEALPEMVAETRKTIATVKSAVTAVDENLTNLKDVTGPLAERSGSIVERLDGTMAHLETVSARLETFSEVLVKEDGTIQRLSKDPQLYQHVTNSAASLSALLRNLEPILADLQVFSDKIARHPELIGVSGALKGSSGIKRPEEDEQPRPRRGPIRRTGGTPPFRRN